MSDTCDTPIEGQQAVDGQFIEDVRTQILRLLSNLQDAAQLGQGDILVVGASTSEVIGARIGTATSMEVGHAMVDAVLSFASSTGCDVAFQCCEHLNRALVVDKSIADRLQLQRVAAVPVPGAGGAMAAAAYFRLQTPCLVAHLEADAGIDIGDTFIGMHLKHVAVPVRGERREIGAAHVTMAKTRPPLVGGARAIYDVDEARRRIETK